MPPKATFFIIRSSGTQDWTGACPPVSATTTSTTRIVPLIPADMLPDWIEVEGFPRALHLEETVGMTNVGSFSPPSRALTVKLLSQKGGDTGVSGKQSTDGNRSFLDDGSSGLEFDYDGCNSSRLFMQPLLPIRPTSLAREFSRETVDEGGQEKGEEEEKEKHTTSSTMPLPEALAALKIDDENCRGSTGEAQHSADDNEEESPRSTLKEEEKREEGSGKKRAVCSFWCRNGWCKFKGHCRYKHEMPQTSAGLAEIGLMGLPRWQLADMLAHLPDPITGLTLSNNEASELLRSADSSSGGGGSAVFRAKEQPKRQQKQHQQKGKKTARLANRNQRPKSAASEARGDKVRSGHKAGEVVWERVLVLDEEKEVEEDVVDSFRDGESSDQRSGELVTLLNE